MRLPQIASVEPLAVNARDANQRLNACMSCDHRMGLLCTKSRGPIGHHVLFNARCPIGALPPLRTVNGVTTHGKRRLTWRNRVWLIGHSARKLWAGLRGTCLPSIDELSKRRRTCDGCEFRSQRGPLSRCKPCGCFVWAKVRVATEACPKGKWGRAEAPDDCPSFLKRECARCKAKRNPPTEVED